MVAIFEKIFFVALTRGASGASAAAAQPVRAGQTVTARTFILFDLVVLLQTDPKHFVISKN